MAYKKEKRKQETGPEYVPMKWVQTSGLSIETDGEYIMCLIGNGPREKEIERLGLIHSWDWARAVKSWVKAHWGRRDEIRAKHPRYSPEEAMEIINAAIAANGQTQTTSTPEVALEY